MKVIIFFTLTKSVLHFIIFFLKKSSYRICHTQQTKEFDEGFSL